MDLYEGLAIYTDVDIPVGRTKKCTAPSGNLRTVPASVIRDRCCMALVLRGVSLPKIDFSVLCLHCIADDAKLGRPLARGEITSHVSKI